MAIQNIRNFGTIILLISNIQIYAESLGIADSSAGQKRAAICFGCHGTNGISNIPGTPHLAGQQRAYLEKALHAYREGIQRQDPIMNSMAKPLTDADIVNIAAYFNSLSR